MPDEGRVDGGFRGGICDPLTFVGIIWRYLWSEARDLDLPVNASQRKRDYWESGRRCVVEKILNI